jgi:hypothetical protein
MKSNNTFEKLFSSVSTLAVVAGAMAFNGVAWGQTGTVLCFNSNGYGQCDVPAAAQSGVSAIAGGYNHTIALKYGGVLAWGDNQYGQCTIPAAANSGISAIAGGVGHTIAIKGGAVLAWGDNQYGQCNVPSSAQSGVSDIACGYNHTIALKDGAVLAWGENYYGQCTIPNAAQTGVSAIAGGGGHTIALKNGDVLARGNNYYGQCNVRNGCTAIAGGGNHTIGLRGGQPLAWGYNCCNQLDIGDGFVFSVSAIAGGDVSSYALKAGGVVMRGCCKTSQLPQSGIIAIAGGGYHIIALQYSVDPNDTDGDGIPNASDNCPSVANPTQVDCDGNGVGDACEIQLDCNSNGIADICEILSGAVTDQNLNGIPDTCEVTTVTRVQPISGPSTGGTAVRIIGTNFFSALPVSVTFGGAPATNVVVVSLTEITAVTPSGSPGDTFVGVNGAGAEEFYYRPSCDGDLDNNGTIDSSDLGLLLINMGDCSSSLITQQPQEPMIFPIAEAAKPVAVKK